MMNCSLLLRYAQILFFNDKIRGNTSQQSVEILKITVLFSMDFHSLFHSLTHNYFDVSSKINLNNTRHVYNKQY